MRLNLVGEKPGDVEILHCRKLCAVWALRTTYHVYEGVSMNVKREHIVTDFQTFPDPWSREMALSSSEELSRRGGFLTNQLVVGSESSQSGRT